MVRPDRKLNSEQISNDMRMLNEAVNSASESDVGQEYAARHGIDALSVGTVLTDEIAAALVEYLEPRIAGKTVVEIGGGFGLLALHMGFVATKVFTIEANPIWTNSFVALLLNVKPPNVNYLFGAANQFVGQIKGDVALFCSHSDISGMKQVASQFAPEVIDVYGEIMGANPENFDQLAQALRSMT